MLQASRLVLIDALLADGDSLFRTLVLVLAGSILLTLSAKIQIPFYPVPMTLQTLVVLLLVSRSAGEWGLPQSLHILRRCFRFTCFCRNPEKG